MTARALFVLLGEIGHINPFIGVCQRLARESVEIAVHCSGDFTAQFERAGVHVKWFGATKSIASPPAAGALLAARMRNPRWLDRWYQVALATLPREMASIDAAVKSFRPNLLCTDALDVAAAVVAEREHLPWAAISTNLAALRPAGWSCPFLDVGAHWVPQALNFQGAPDLTIDGSDAVSPWFNSVFTTEALVPRDQTANRHSHYVGPPRSEGSRGDEPAFPWERLDGRPLVYVSSGGGQSLSFDPPMLLRIANSLRASEAQIVMATQHLHDDEAFLAALPEHCISVRYAPQLKLLERAAAAVTHGGVNSFNESLDQGCPTLVLPLGKEQPLQGELASRAGVGITLDPLIFTEDQCREALLALIANGSYRQRAAAVRDSYHAANSTAVICDAITLLARGEKPAWPTA